MFSIDISYGEGWPCCGRVKKWGGKRLDRMRVGDITVRVWR
jgi:hypothetical protein